MKNAKVYHGGAAPGGKFSSKGNGNGSSEIITLNWVNDENLNIGDEITAPTLGFAYQADSQGWFFPEQYTLIELHYLFNDFTTFSINQTITIQMRRKLADGSNPAGVVVSQDVTQFPNGGGQYMGNSNTGLGVIIPVGYQVYGYVSGISANDVDGVSIWGRFRKG